MAELGFLNRSSRLSPTDAAFHVEAIRTQMQHLAALYGIEPIACVLYSEIPADGEGIWPIAILDDIGDPSALGYHEDVLGTPDARTLDPGKDDATTPSHEAAETTIDPTCNEWRPWPAGGEVAYEVADPVEGDSYPIETTLFGETRLIRVSNLVLPSWFIADAPPPYDVLGKLTRPFSMSPGGYLVLRRADGTTEQIFERDMGPEHLARIRRKVSTPGSRLYRRLVGAGTP